MCQCIPLLDIFLLHSSSHPQELTQRPVLWGADILTPPPTSDGGVPLMQYSVQKCCQHKQYHTIIPNVSEGRETMSGMHKHDPVS